MKLRIKAISLLINQSRYDKCVKLNVTRIFVISFLYIFFLIEVSRLFRSIQFYFIPGNKMGAESVTKYKNRDDYQKSGGRASAYER